jgi:hypothetical protein
MDILGYGSSVSARNIHMNQVLRAHQTAITHRQTHSNALDSRHQSQKLLQKLMMFSL